MRLSSPQNVESSSSIGSDSRQGRTRVEAAALMLSLEPGCIRGLKWRLDVPPDRLYMERVARQLLSIGFREATPGFSQGGFLSFRSPLGHDILCVPRTGRIQIRLDRLTQERDRHTVAREIATVVESALSWPRQDQVSSRGGQTPPSAARR